MSSLKNLAGQTAVYGLSSIVGRFLNYLLTPLYTYQFVAKDYGVVTEMYAYVAFLVVLLTFGMETAYFRFVSRSEFKQSVYNAALLPVVVSATIFMGICIAFSGSLSAAISYPDNPEFVIWFAIIVGLDAISSIPLARLRQENKATRFVGINLSSIALNIGLNLFFIAYCKVMFDSGRSNWIIDMFYDPAIGVGYIFIANLLASIFKCLLLLPFMTGLSISVDRKTLRSMLIYGAPLLIAGVAGIANENLDRILLKYLLLEDIGLSETMTQVGIYGACYKVSILITLFVQAYRYAAEPFFFNKSVDVDAKETYAEMMKYFVLTCLVVFLGLMMNIDIVMLFVGEEYRVGAQIVPILLLANIFLGIYYNLSVWYKLTDKTMYGAYISIVGAILTVLFNLALIPKLGYVGSAWTTLICYAGMMTMSYFWGRKHYHIHYPIKKLAAYSALILIIYLGFDRLDLANSNVKILLGNLVLALVTLGIIFLERPKKIIT
ncbi:MAG TPA: polysaccharide biosynthesis protein [Flavobacteriales bacterium]|nr:polysaccharide biosynthesis protein [Flavobacteriales bacterium]